MPLNWPDISQNQMFQASLGLLGAGTDRRVNPFLAAQQGLTYGGQMDKNAKEEARLDEEAARRKKLEDAWGGMFGVPGASPDMAGGGGSGIVAGDGALPQMPMPGQMGGPGPIDLTGAFPRGPQMASASPDMTGMGGPMMAPQQPGAAPGAQQGNPMLAGLPPGMIPLLSALPPEQGIPFLLDRMNRKPEQRRIVQGADGFNYYEDGSRVLPGIEAKPDKPPVGYRIGEDGNLEADPGWLATQLELKRAGKSDVNVRLPSQENEEAKAVGKWYGEAFTSLQDGATAARAANARLDRIGQLLEGVGTGKTAPTTQSYKAAAKSIGIDLEAFGVTDDVGPAEAAQALSAQMALELRNPAGGAGMPGAMSDKDREFLQSMVPGLGTSPEGRKLMIETQKRVNERSIEVARMARAYRKENGRLDEGFYDELDAFSRENPLFDDMEAPQQSQIPPPSERQIGAWYTGPNGRGMWTAEGWVMEEDLETGGAR